MPKLQRGTRLVVASHNPGKVREILDLVAPHGLVVVSAGELGLPEPEETGTTFAANAELKALAAARAAGLPALADDSGLEVRRWAARPASIRRAGPGPTRISPSPCSGWPTSAGARRLAARATPGPRANFIAVLCLAWPDGATRDLRGQGLRPSRLAAARRARVSAMIRCSSPTAQTLTFGEMEPDAKHAISHRARAFALFARACLASRRGGA